MVEEFGLYDREDISIPSCFFVKEMREYCGSVVTIRNLTCSNSRYFIEEDDCCFFWTDDMFEPYKVSIQSQTDFINKEAYDKLIKQLENRPIIFAPQSSTDGYKVATGLIENIAKETREMVKKNIETEIKKKKVHPKDEDHLKRVEKIQKRIDYYSKKSGFDLIEEVVSRRVVKVTYYRKEYKMVCDPRDTFSMEKVLYLALAKHIYGWKYTSEGIEQIADELKYKREYVKKVEQAMKMLAAIE